MAKRTVQAAVVTSRLNSELAKKPRECLEYIVVPEMVHLLEPTHNARFVAHMDRFLQVVVPQGRTESLSGESRGVEVLIGPVARHLDCAVCGISMGAA